MTKITYHPDIELVKRYACGDLTGGVALLVAAHIEMCPHCQKHQAEFEQSFADEAFAAQSDNASLDGMLSQMLDTLPEVPEPAAKPQLPPLTLEQQRFVLPRVLANQIHKVSGWSAQLGKLHQARLELGDHSLQLIHMAKNSSVPAHTHKGQEVTLVLHGGFSDEQGDYFAGDFIALDQRHQHQPFTDDDEDCLVISAVDAPLQFTSGFARLLNPLSNLFFKP